MQPSLPVPGLAWGLPFVGTILTIALGPILFPRTWDRRMGLICAAWAAALLLPWALAHGAQSAISLAWEALAGEYAPFVALLLALYAIGGGIMVRGGPAGTPAGNTALLAIGTALAGVMGTTGASMVLIHPLLRANAHRTRKVHLVVFFILLVANVGGATSPLGDPPLYLGFLHGVPFFWPLRHQSLPMLVVALPLLGMFWLVDRRLASNDPAPQRERLHIRGTLNFVLLAAVILAVLGEGVFPGGDVGLPGIHVPPARLVAVGVFVGSAAISAAFTPLAVRDWNMFAWHPIAEVAKLFAAIFITIAPALEMLRAGLHGPLAAALAHTIGADGEPIAAAFFWMAGLLSAFLDNAPTYLVFFELAGGEATRLTTELAQVLAALACGAVFFGAVTYIGNAPNLMVRAVAAHRGVRMPGFFGYMAWSVALLVPCFVVVCIIFFI
jgi:Na+/H+ antiporter NhaD/arsenite permease-like protein